MHYFFLVTLLITAFGCNEKKSSGGSSLIANHPTSSSSTSSTTGGLSNGGTEGGSSTGGTTGISVETQEASCPGPVGDVRIVSEGLYQINTSEALFGAKIGGQHHIFAIYSSALAPLVNSQIAHFNLDTKEVNVVAGLPGRHAVNLWLNSGKIYINSNTPLFSGVYDIANKTFTDLGAPGLNVTDRIGKTLISSNGSAFVTTSTRGSLAKIDLTTSSLQKTAVLDLPNWFVGANSADVQLLNIKIDKNLTTGDNFGIIQLAAPISAAPLKIKIENSTLGKIDGIYETIKGSFAANKMSWKIKAVGKEIGTFDNAGLKLVNHECYGCNRSIDTVEADNQYVYMPIRNVATGKFWLIIRSADMGSAQEVSCFFDDKKKSLVVKRTSTGQIYFVINGQNFLANGSNCPSTLITSKITAPPVGQNKNFATGEVLYNLKNTTGYNAWKAATGLILNLSKFEPNTFTGGASILSFLPNNSTSAISESLSAEDINLYGIKSAQFSYLESINKILVGVGGYSRFFMIDPVTTDKLDLGNLLSVSPYDITHFNNNVYLTGYPARTYKFDISKVWTSSSYNSTVLCQSLNAPNPCLLSSAFASTHSYGRVDNTGKLFVLGNYSKEAYLGGEVGWDDGQSPFSNYREKLEAEDLIPETSCYQLSQLMRLKDGKELVFQGSYLAGTATNHTCPNDSSIPKFKIFYFDTETKKITQSFNLDRIFNTITPINDSFAWGVKITNEKVGLETFQVAKINLTNGSYSFIKSFPGNVYPVAKSLNAIRAGAEGVVDSIGNLYLPVGASLVKVAIEDGKMDIITELGAASGLFKVKNEACTKGQLGMKCVCLE